MPIEPGPELLRDWIARAAQRHPAKPWIVCADDGRTVTYRELHEATGRIAAFLYSRGIGTNQRVALLANNSIEHLICYFGVMAHGATICTVHVEMNRNQLDNIFARLKPALVLHQDGLGLDDLLSAVAAPCLRLGRLDGPDQGTFYAEVARHEPSDTQTSAGPDDDAVILFTSGTSARPKGVVLNYREHLGNIDPTADGFGITADDRVYDFRSFNWASAQLLGALVPVNRGATLVMTAKFSASRFFQHIRDHGVTIAAGNPTTINILLNTETDAQRNNLPSLRFITSSSAPLTIEEWRRFEARFGIPIAQGYGSSETGWIAASSRRATAPRHGRPAIRLSLPRGRRCRRPTAAGRRDRPGRNRRPRIARLPLSRRRRQREDRQPRPHPHRRPGPCSMPTVFSASPAARRTSSSAAASTSRRSRSIAS